MTKGTKQISAEEVKKIAQLARIQLTKEEVKKFEKELASILDYVQEIDEIDTTNVESTPHTDLTSVYREDTVTTSLSQDKATANRRKTLQDDFFTIKSVLDNK